MVLRTVLRVVLIAVGTLFVGLAGILITFGTSASSSGDVNSMVVSACLTRSVLVAALLMAMTWTYRIRDRKAVDKASRPYKQVLLAAGIAYFVNFSSWYGHMLFGQLLVPAGLPSLLFDFVVWMAVAVVGVRLGDRAKVQAKVAAIPYA